MRIYSNIEYIQILFESATMLIFHHPSKPIVYIFPFFNSWTPSVSVTADATYNDFMNYSEHTSADPHHCSLYMPLVKSPP